MLRGFYVIRVVNFPNARCEIKEKPLSFRNISKTASCVSLSKIKSKSLLLANALSFTPVRKKNFFNSFFPLFWV